MPDFTAQERGVADAAPVPAPKPFRVSEFEVHYAGLPHRYVAVLKGASAPKSAAELMEPGAWDDVGCLEPWDEISITWGITPQDAWTMRLRVIGTKKHGLRGFERAAGLVERDHTVVAIVSAACQATTHWGEEPVAVADEGKISRTGKA